VLPKDKVTQCAAPAADEWR